MASPNLWAVEDRPAPYILVEALPSSTQRGESGKKNVRISARWYFLSKPD